MITYENSFVVDFGEVGYRTDRQPFLIRLNADGLTALINDSLRGSRIYEIFKIQRPGDIWRYLVVEFIEVPKRVQEKYQYRWEERKPKYGGEHPWPDQVVPLLEFDGFFMYAWDDTEPEDQCWLDHRYSSVMRAIADQLFAQVRVAQGHLDWNDPLMQHEIASIREGKHPYDYLDSSRWLGGLRAHKPNPPRFKKAFYEKAESLVSDLSVVSVAWRGGGDHDLFRLLCREQRKRADRSGHKPGHALAINALTNDNPDVEPWGSTVNFYSEGIGYGDLFIEQACLGNSIKNLVETGHKAPGRYILAVRDEGTIDGFSKESGDGWVLYRRDAPFSHRHSVTRSADYMSPPVEQLLTLENDSGSFGIFDHEHIVFVVQGDPYQSDWKALAEQVRRIEHKGGPVTVVVSSDDHAFLEAGCGSVVFSRGVGRPVGGAPLDWDRRLPKVLREADVLFLVETDEPLESKLTDVLHLDIFQGTTRLPYVISAGPCGEALSSKADFKIQGSLADWLAKAIRN